ncbi:MULTISPECIES: bifunctional 4-hydroxy-2-oxoglutarate aldolase/2-dehydro-3-deoxy-phosphogluconate aldolase [unclassified Undibacterium]|uniref:bifunctional 4-hydroxy-2-oxoglutarate aldolase/2-dehydro-3-deoxy-phosphogluconate aldolase n=1 Tax=unclassified Undibacterium TaxID=2630295 RepID=UPI002AC9C32A|nr:MULTISPECIES: bifunctional 4-hydroxy-2-oxoglutarate aldolase/2-dehydro-3-deoxy-phosphogluconate aldolase [unclassified Undibacterium]MEB0139175.1 bifunctional 4-hydroxy-2-oxoglutarate aldolase/2-dehydro-3-deoxy-phosphogluconate aldolase [Undibacterium sp. CCC2.1]MEB0172250.1 bifunctional 4-hydroxy-2-oxoglutarate aldolase/2-dehydro-3-deoxy-phosphogluconate aldolase [Undibacterium sp. CCC1.1]MEB0175893.1 bifunctional 4-hydroxy-2-oxoglutarate aldolase/2-dehydro-3-deoxy-phosphogluconate aldolase 
MTTHTTQSIIASLEQLRVLPILVTDDVDQAIRCVQTLAANGLPAVEITLRTPNAMTVLREVVKACPEVTVGAGTILTAAQLDAVRDAGAAFGISPGITPLLAKAAQESGLPYFPGVGGASDLMLALEHGFQVVKLFPSDIVGSTKMAKALGGPFPDVRFCLTGGVTVEATPGLLQQANILCVGGSWMCPAALIQNADWAAIAVLSAAAAQAGQR